MFCGSAVVRLLDRGRMTCLLHPFATTTPTSWWSVSMRLGLTWQRVGHEAPHRAMDLAQVEC